MLHEERAKNFLRKESGRTFLSALLRAELCPPSFYPNPNMYVEATTSNVTIFRDRASKEVIMVNETIRVESLSDRLSIPCKKRKQRVFSLSLSPIFLPPLWQWGHN